MRLGPKVYESWLTVKIPLFLNRPISASEIPLRRLKLSSPIAWAWHRFWYSQTWQCLFRFSIGGCSAPSISSRACSGREPGYPGPPAQIPTCGFPASGSYRRSQYVIGGLDARRSCRFTAPVTCRFRRSEPGLVSQLTFPSTRRFPPAVSACWLSPKLCSRHRTGSMQPSELLHPFPSASFIFSTSRRGPAPPRRGWA